jgi:hypothetical protein
MNYTFDYEEVKDIFNLELYDIYIYNPKYNFINIYNKDFDGTKYNNIIKSDYLFRKKKFRNEKFNINTYNFVYHIFILNYFLFNFNYPINKQFIHLYPGGGLDNLKYISNIENNINTNVNLIVTQEFISKHVTRKNKIELFGAPLFFKNEELKRKKINNTSLTICFTCIGKPIDKGGLHYIDIATIYKTKYMNDNINFISIGTLKDNTNTIKSYPPMEQIELDKFYYDNVDILINLTTGHTIDGFPLGIEGIINGTMLLTTDTYDMNSKNNFNFDNFIIISKNNLDMIVDKIKTLYDDRNLLFNKTIELQNKVFSLFNYNKMIENKFDFIEMILQKINL